jgi:hypothetical protein
MGSEVNVASLPSTSTGRVKVDVYVDDHVNSAGSRRRVLAPYPTSWGDALVIVKVIGPVAMCRFALLVHFLSAAAVERV